MRTLLLLCAGLLTGAAAGAQPLNKASYESMLEVAQECLDGKDHYNALSWYEKAFEERQEVALLPIIADLHYKLRDYVKAERTYARLLRRDRDNQYADLRFPYGRVLKMNGKYEEAIKELQEFLAHTKDERLKKLAQSELTGAEMALELPPTTRGATIEHGGRLLNSPFSEYSAVLNRGGNTMYFTGFGAKDVILLDDDKEEYFARVFTSTKGERGWSAPEPVRGQINRPGFHTGNVALSPDGNTLFFTRAKLEGNVLSESKIYYSVGGDGSWGAANEVAGVNGDYIAKHPAAGELFGREVLFFVSDMEGGYGGFDIYYATRRGDGVYGDPVNLGPRINTAGDEETPFYRDGTLYFSSTGHPGLGGFDIFYSTWDGERWSEPTNMGYGYNSSYDDRYFTLDADGYSGALLSNRPGGGRSVHGRTCCDDIFTVTVARIHADLVVGTFDEKRQVLKGATVSLIPMPNNRPGTPNNQTSETGNRFGFDLELNTPYVVVAAHPDYYPDTTQFNTGGLTASKTFEHRFYLKAKPVPPPEPLYDTLVIEEPIVLENILYDFDSDRIKQEAETDLEVILELLNQYPQMKIELRSHTDYRGDDNYNLNLSQRRAESARRWLINRGIPRARMEAKGYGETVPFTVKAKEAAQHNFLKEGDVLTPAFIDALANEEQKEIAHAFNRRTEFRILEGPTSIIIERTRLRKQEPPKPTPRRQRLFEMPNDSVKIHQWSSLFGQKELKGVPIMHFEQRSVDFGKVKKGEKRAHVFEFVNRGDVDLVIDLISACDCTKADYSARTVKPGQKGSIKVVFDSSEKDEAETIDVDIFLKNRMPDGKGPIVETLRYRFDIVK
jgi:peptidoglycan-associated lipoprotein